MLGSGKGTFNLLSFEDGVLFGCLCADKIRIVSLGNGDEGVYSRGI